MNSRGFTLLELMIVVAIIGVLAGIAIPSYTQYVQKARRSDAKTALLALQQAQEKLRSNCNVYAEVLDKNLTVDGNVVAYECTPGDAANTTLRFDTVSSEELYTLSVSSASAIGYTAVATAVNTGDPNCKYIRLVVDDTTPNGVWKASSSDTGTPDTTAQCL